MTPLLITLLIGASAGILLGTAGAKIQAAAHTRLAWPQGANFLRLHLSSGFVIAVEIVTAAIALALPSARPACLVLALVYAAFVVGATTLRGQECGCFGIDGMTVGPVHIGGCALASVLLALVALVGGSAAAPRPGRIALAILLAAAIVLAAQLWSNRRAAHATRAGEGEDYDRLLVVLSPTCSACSALKIMEKHEVDDAEFDGAIQWVDRDSAQAASLREAGVEISGYPAVVSVATGDPTGARVESGLRECREVLQSWRTRRLAPRP